MVETEAEKKSQKEKGSQMLGGTHAALHEDIYLNARIRTQNEPQEGIYSFEGTPTTKVAYAGGLPDVNTRQSHMALHEDMWLASKLRVETNTLVSNETSRSSRFEESGKIGTHGFEEGSSGSQNEPI